MSLSFEPLFKAIDSWVFLGICSLMHSLCVHHVRRSWTSLGSWGCLCIYLLNTECFRLLRIPSNREWLSKPLCCAIMSCSGSVSSGQAEPGAQCCVGCPKCQAGLQQEATAAVSSTRRSLWGYEVVILWFSALCKWCLWLVCSNNQLSIRDT